VVGAAKVVRDITARRRDEEQLRKLSCAVEQSPAAVMITDVTGRIEYVNRTFTQVTGYSLEETLGKNPRMLKSGRMSVEAYRDLWAAITTGQIWRGELENRKKNGQLFWERDTISPLLDQAGKVTHYIAIMEDITGSKRAEEKIRQLNNELEQRVIERTAQLEAANKELEAFTYSVSHDLRAPLRAVDGFSKIVLEDYGPQLPQGCRQDLQTIRNGAQRMGELIDDLLAFSRLSRLPLSKQAVDTGKLVRGALEELNCQQNGRRIEFRVASLPPCHADPALLKQVWVNLLSNALKYTGKCEAAVVEIGCATENGRNVWFVRDNGTGFDMKYAHKLFGVFQRLHRAEDYEGTGVGLAIVQRIIHRHGGRVWAESGVNRGATFYFTLEGETKP
jgi:PAS domain S-box-containing protein